MHAKSQSGKLRGAAAFTCRPKTARNVVLALLCALCAPAASAQQLKETDADLQFEFAERLFQIRAYKTAAPEYRKFLNTYATDRRREEARYKLAVSYFSFRSAGEKERKKALAELLTLRKEFPNGKRIQDCHFRSGHIRYLLGDRKGAIADLLALAKLKVRADLKIPMHHFLGRAYYDLGQDAKAVKYVSVVAAAPKQTKLRRFALVVLGNAYLRLNRLEESAATLDLLLKDYPSLPTKEEMRLKLGDARLALRQFQKAFAAYSALDPRGQFKHRATLGKARALLGLKRYPEARRAAKALLGSFRETPATKGLGIRTQCSYIMASASFNQGKHADAAAAYVELLRQVKQGAMAEDSSYKLCWSYYRQGTGLGKKLVASCVSFRRSFPASKWVGQIVFLTAEGYLWLRDYPNAIANYRKIDEKDANYADALYRIAYSYHRHDKREEAARAYDRFAKKFGRHQRAAEAMAGAGGLYQAAGKYKDAIGRYSAYLAKSRRGPVQAEVMYQRGVCYAKLSQFDKMAVAFGEHTRAYPTGKHAAASFYWLGRHHRIRGDTLGEKGDLAGATREYSLAGKAFRSSAALNRPNKNETLFALAECDYNLGRNQIRRADKLAAKAKGATGQEKKRLQAQVAGLEKGSAAAFATAAKGFLYVIAKEPKLLKQESVYFWAGAHFREHKDPKSAIRVFKALIRNFATSKRTDVALYQLALLHAELKRPEYNSVVRYCDELIKRCKASKLVLQTKFAKAEALYAQHRHRSAEPLYIEVSQKGAGLLKVGSDVKLGRIYFAGKEYAAAVARFARVALLYEHETFTPEALYFAGKGNLLLNDTNEATKFWQQLLKGYKESKWTAVARKELLRLGYVIRPDGSIRKR